VEAGMQKKRRRPEKIISKPREADVPIRLGMMVVEVIKALCATDVTWYRWRQENGGGCPYSRPGAAGNSRENGTIGTWC